MVLRSIFASPSQAFSVPINNANGSPLEKPKPSMHAALRDPNPARSNANPRGRAKGTPSAKAGGGVAEASGGKTVSGIGAPAGDKTSV